MSKLDDLIKELCPNGVEYKTLGDIGTFERGRRFVHADDREDGIPCIHYGELYTHYGVYAKEVKTHINSEITTKLRYAEKNDVIIVAAGENKIDIGIAVAWLGDEKVAIHDACYIYRHKQNPVYLSYIFRTHEYHQFLKKYVAEGKICSVSSDSISKYEIPVPPLEVQNEIVRILDKFITLKTELETELEVRRKQYEWAKQQLLNIKKEKLFELQELCNIEKGKTPIQKAIPGEYPLVVTTDKRSSCIDYQFDCKAVCLSLVSARGHGVAQISRIFYQEGKFALGNILCAMIPKDEKILNAKYLQYYLFYMKDILLTPLMKGGANVALHISDLQKVKIPVPTLEEQQRIVSILNRFDSICNDITTGLPAEIEARHKQYEYYRDKLLTFNRKEG
ncbi:type I restriction enzyme, S subunit [Treponema bryantii]|uniref:Type I restriction enzyme, S subunit n=1 Tax=Treponema bryantii TaxID=163 RepID=A0A1I3K732_9SPIR|nr:restriction endonuclease subunit S [Treponema bryantii]SFI68331.1 type I restriction enzyme, S subunit [Treponema bryantii]